MKRIFRAFIMCQSMFMNIPIPCRVWDEDARSDMLLFLPVIGLEIGLLWAGAAWLCRYCALPARIEGLILCAVPFVLTGSIHMDGFMDVMDAICSWRDAEKRRQILKDPHVGSFAVIGCVFVILASYVLFAEGTVPVCALIFIPVISRFCSALAVLNIRPMPGSQYASSFKRSVWRDILVFLLLAAAVTLGFVFCGRYGFLSVAGILGYALALCVSVPKLRGMNGDTAGFALIISELAAVLLCAVI